MLMGDAHFLRIVRLIRRNNTKERGGGSARLTHVTRLCPTVGKEANELKGVDLQHQKTGLKIQNGKLQHHRID
jgi:hypothetical protein